LNPSNTGRLNISQNSTTG